MTKGKTPKSPRAAALLGALFLLPFLTANTIVSKRIEPFFSFIRPGANTSAFEMVLLAVVLACMPFGAYIAARPLFNRSEPRGARAYLLNGVVAFVLIAAFVTIGTALGDEIYRCDVLGLPNCD